MLSMLNRIGKVPNGHLLIPISLHLFTSLSWSCTKNVPNLGAFLIYREELTGRKRHRGSDVFTTVVWIVFVSSQNRSINHRPCHRINQTASKSEHATRIIQRSRALRLNLHPSPVSWSVCLQPAALTAWINVKFYDRLRNRMSRTLVHCKRINDVRSVSFITVFWTVISIARPSSQRHILAWGWMVRAGQPPKRQVWPCHWREICQVSPAL